MDLSAVENLFDLMLELRIILVSLPVKYTLWFRTARDVPAWLLFTVLRARKSANERVNERSGACKHSKEMSERGERTNERSGVKQVNE